METWLLIVVVILLVVVVVLQVLLLRRRVGLDLSPIEPRFASLERSAERVNQSVREEIATNRAEVTRGLGAAREEQSAALRGLSDSLVSMLGQIAQQQKDQLALVAGQTNERLKQFDGSLNEARQGLIKTVNDLSANQQRQLSTFSERLDTLTQSLEQRQESVRQSIETKVGEMRQTVESKLGEVRQTVEAKLGEVRQSVEQKLAAMQQDNATKLEEMRKTVDEKLQGTLEQRLGESFKQVSERLEAVYKGLGEMQTLASGVGDLKKVLTNVKSRGTWGEVQLGAMLEQVLMSDQYARNVATTGTRERVEFAVKLPGNTEEPGSVVWLPIDAKFPIENYQRLVEAQEAGDEDAVQRESKELEDRIWRCAKDIREKYVAPPATTDFGILYLPIEGLFAEVMRRPGLPEQVQQEYRVMIAGPTTLWSLLNSLQMGFRTLAIQKRTGEVWNLLRAVKTEFEKYGEVLAKVKKNLDDASETIENKVATRVRAINRKLSEVERFSANDPRAALLLEADSDDGETNNE